jgi:acyl carrier protein
MQQNYLEDIIHGINPFDDFDSDTDLLGEGILDSMSLMVAIDDIEKKMEVNIPENEISPDNFHSVKTIEHLINNIRDKG